MSPADKSLNVWKYEIKIKSYFDKDIQTDLRYTIYCRLGAKGSYMTLVRVADRII